MIRREHAHISAVPGEIVIDDLAALALLDTTVDPARIVWANPAFSSVLSRGAGDIAGSDLEDVVDDPDLAEALAAASEGDERTVRLAGAGNAAIVLQLSPTGERGRVLLVARPAHSTPRAAMYDAVTGLASLALFREHLQLAAGRPQHLPRRARLTCGGRRPPASVVDDHDAVAELHVGPQAGVVQHVARTKAHSRADDRRVQP